MNKYDTSQLTEFPRFEDESSQSGVSTFFNKLWKFPLFSPSETAENLQTKALADERQAGSQTENQNRPEYEEKPETGSYAVEFEGRSLPNVLKRISSLVALGSGGGTRYADTELARYWMPDDISRECYECASRFSALRRRHHCRVCGQIFCSRCCSQRVPGQIFGCAGGLRVCNYCCNIVLSYLKENEVTGDMSTDLRTLQENLQVKFPENKSQQAHSRDHFVFASEQDERCETRPEHRQALQHVFTQLSRALPPQQHRYRLVRYNGVWRGCDVLQWIMDNTSHKTRAQAALLCQGLVSAGYLHCCTELPHFADYALYQPAAPPPPPPLPPARDPDPEECPRMVESVSSYCLDLNLGDSSARLIKAPKPETKSSPYSEDDNPILENSEGGTECRQACRALEQAGAEHLALLLRQCLARAALAAGWLRVLAPLCRRAAELVLPDALSTDMDVRNYVQVKKAAGGAPRDSRLIHGVVVSKNVAHRGMPQEISNPTVLLLDCSIAYQRVEGKLTSLEPVLLQEQEYLVRCAARITALRPNVVLVRGSAARTVQDALRKEGVALATGVRERALRRAARCTRAEVVTSIDARIGMPRLGTCKNFYVKNYSSKTLMVLEGCAESHLGCCILLQGASLPELTRVKKVVKFMLLAYYNWKLEKAFLADIDAILPEPGMTFDDDNDVFNDKTDRNKDEDDGDDDSNETVNLNYEMKTDATCSNAGITNRASIAEDIVKSIENTENSSIAKTENKKNENCDKGAAKSIGNVSNNAATGAVTEDENYSDDEVARNIVNDIDESIKADSEDPLQKAKIFRKADSDKTLSCGVPIRDFSDPLQSTLSVDDDVFLPKVEANLQTEDAHSDRWSIDDALLSMSPTVIVPPPYLETEAGRRCPLRAHFPRPLVRAAPRPAPHTPRAARRAERSQRSHDPPKEMHPFISRPITATADDIGVRATLAHYRATGCRLDGNTHTPGCALYNPSVVRKPPKDPDVESSEKQNESKEPPDPFAPESHQRLSLLLYSYSNKSSNVPDFCVNPWVVTMELYGRHDISLGAFLEKYCFDGLSKCGSNNCQVPVNQHVRRFVHGDVCITITCNTVGHSSVDKLKEGQSKHVMFWSRCGRCGAVGRAARLSRAALALSLAQYVRARAAGCGRLLRAGACRHALHDHAHAFVRGHTTACLRLSKISTFDISLPPRVISTRYDTRVMRDALIAQLNELMLKGHETFSSETDSEAERDYQSFKLHTEQIHLALTSSQLQEQSSLAAVVRSLWHVSDSIISGEKMLRDAQEKWSSPVKPVKPPPESSAEEKPDIEDSSGDPGNDSSGTEEDEEKGDKKTVRQILSQLLTNNQPANQAGMIVSSGVVPVVVLAGEVGSVIAATLASVTYQRALRAHRHNTQSEQEGADVSAGKDKSEADKQKTNKSNDHIEVLLKDGLVCRVYYAPQFQRLRHMLLAPLGSNPHITDQFATPAAEPPAPGAEDGKCCCEEGREKSDNKCLCDIEEGFLRSLAHCVPWAARGGKSGSTFCKTNDDRYVLKEMTKPEWQQFLEFAPHYFNYVTSCHQQKLPSLLARILGVYSVGGAGNGVLVMENVWYECAPRDVRYDLKGASRHRLSDDTQPLAVLMDENLLNSRWETQLYVQSHVGRVLWAAVERDTAFLAASSVMDYSLLLGVGGRTLVLGLIDYIRTFTWDKKLEHLVKKNLGSGQPTVVSPEQYRRRFALACRKYFLQCPAHWDHLYTTIHE